MPPNTSVSGPASRKKSGRVLVAGLSPAWQQILRFTAFHPGQVNRTQESYWCASGKVLNVARACAALGAETSLVCPVGGWTGTAARNEFAELGIDCHWIETSAATRVCTTILDQSARKTTELVENAGPVSADVLQDFRTALQSQAHNADLVLVSGSLPVHTPPDYLAEALRPIRAPLILDVRGPELLACLSLNPLLAKPNREELAMTFQRANAGVGELRDDVRALVNRGATWTAVSDGARALHAVSDGAAFVLLPPAVPVVNPIACGDCLTAGIAVALLEGKEMIEAICFGMGAAAQNATELLPARIDYATSAAWAARVGVSESG